MDDELNWSIDSGMMAAFEISTLLSFDDGTEVLSGENYSRVSRSEYQRIDKLVKGLKKSRWIYKAAKAERKYTEKNEDEGLIGVFTRHAGHIKPDKKMAGEIDKYVKGFINLNADHVAFFGDVLLGANMITFDRSYEARWWDMLDVNDSQLQHDILGLNSVESHWKVAPNAFNQSCVYMAYLFHNSKELTLEEKEIAKLNCIFMLSVKVFSSMYRNFFKLGTANKSVALATYAGLSKKYGIKNTGSWLNFFKAYAYFILNEESKWYPVYTKFYPDKGLVDMVGGIQVAIKSVLINIRGEMENVLNNDRALQQTGLIKDFGEGDTVIDVVRDSNSYLTYMEEVVSDINSLKKDEIMDIITKLVSSAPERYIEDVLKAIANNHSDKKVSNWLTSIIKWVLDYAHTNNINVGDLGSLMIKLRGMLSSSTVSDVEVKEIKTFGDEFVIKHIPTKSSNHIAATRNAVILYIIARTLLKKRYS